MNKIESLISQYCPDGVEYKTFGEIGTFVRGNGLQKKDFTSSGVGCIHYGQIHTLYNLFVNSTVSYTSIEIANKLRKAESGDLIFATTSENVQDVCKVIGWFGKDGIGVSGDCYIFKHHQYSKFLIYYLQGSEFYNFKLKYATGTKVIRVSGANLSKFPIPIPPLPIQQEIVNILDKFTQLEAVQVFVS